MKAGLRVFWAAATLAFGLAAAPAAAQDAAASAPPAEEVVGPPQLRGFSLNGTVTRQAETPQPRSEPARPPAAERTTAARPPAATPAPAPQQPQVEAQRRPQAEPQITRSAAAPAPAPATSQAAALDEPPASALEAPPTRVVSPFGTAPASMPAALPATGDLPLDDGSGMPSPLPWILALLLGGGAAAYYFRRQRSGYALAGAGGGTFEFRAPEAEAAPRPAPRPPAATPRPAPAPAGIVSTRLRPWLEIEFVPERTIVDAEKAMVQFEVVIFNSGSAPARDVLVEARMFNAGPHQDQEIAAFFAQPVGKGDRVPIIQPLKRMAFRSAVTLTHEQLLQFEVEGRRLFVPLVGFNALYRWSSSEGQTSAAYLVGRDTQGEKLAPFRLDLGPRVFRGLGARQLQLGLRK